MFSEADEIGPDKPTEKCGVVSLYSVYEDAAPYIYYCLRAIQHRGQEAAGIASYSPEKEDIVSIKGLGLVSDVFSPDKLKNLSEKLPGNAGIGHVYYSISLSIPENAQPYVFHTAAGTIAIAHNGILTNADELKQRLKKKGHGYYSGSEEESVSYLLSDSILSGKSIISAIKSALSEVEGSYAFSFMINERVFAARGPLGIRPLCIGELPNGLGYVAASESVALDAIGAKLIRDVRPGELVELTASGIKSYQLFDKGESAHCFFEYVYFARADSVIDGREVYRSRMRIGWRLAKESNVAADVVVPVPDSGRAHATGFSRGSGIKMEEGLMKNRYVARTFIMPDQHLRDISVGEKINPVKSIVDGKRVILVDDSIIRGTTMKRIVKKLRDAGAREVHVRIGSPPVIAPCYLGIDMTNREQFVAYGHTVEEIREIIGADSLAYISIEGLMEALKGEENRFCLGCVTGEYPIKIKGEKLRLQKTLQDY